MGHFPGDPSTIRSWAGWSHVWGLEWGRGTWVSLPQKGEHGRGCQFRIREAVLG